MPDVADLAEDFNGMSLDRALRKARAHLSLPDCKACHNCSEDLPAGQRFCSTECRVDYERREAAKHRNGI